MKTKLRKNFLSSGYVQLKLIDGITHISSKFYYIYFLISIIYSIYVINILFISNFDKLGKSGVKVA